MAVEPGGGSHIHSTRSAFRRNRGIIALTAALVVVTFLLFTSKSKPAPAKPLLPHQPLTPFEDPNSPLASGLFLGPAYVPHNVEDPLRPGPEPKVQPDKVEKPKPEKTAERPKATYSTVAPLKETVEITPSKEDVDHDPHTPENHSNYTTTLVVGRLDDDPAGVKWIHDTLTDITKKAIYIVDDPKAPLHLNKNKGREAMVYLRYILDFYDELEDVTLFFHSSRVAWHNNMLFVQDAAIMINNLRRDYVVEKGYMPARCELYPGCGNWIKFNPTKEENQKHLDRNADLFTKELWDNLFPNRTHDPTWLSEPCCSQFAASRDAIRQVPWEQWKRIHDWLAEADISDVYTGRIMEYTWQYLFTGQEEYCPTISDCYCRGYGVCLINDGPLKEYNKAREDVDKTMEDIGFWNDENCPTKDKECMRKNPHEEKLKEVRRKKQKMEEEFPGKYGIVQP